MVKFLGSIPARAATLASLVWPVFRIVAVIIALVIFNKLAHRGENILNAVYEMQDQVRRQLAENRTYYSLAETAAGKVKKYHEAHMAQHAAEAAARKKKARAGRRRRNQGGP
ncbi:MAG: hypothetical protein GTN53_37690 [Candidatus Aminicenantes bacterium]|nr:hypothetical protein [Candidatus Aminicenantes bacterium]NIQ72216.1 hypothetical protein [Candidatus Aminicenantes bacterium]NIT28252.1 hypothetical protein [Candidatus Aminicenantes bacterium]